MEVKEKLLPREKADRYGIASLTDVELVALLVNTGNRKEDVLSLSRRLLSDVGGLNGLAKAEKKTLSIYGIKHAKAYRILACFEIEKRLPLEEKKRIHTIEEAIHEASKYFHDLESESCLFFGLSRNHRLLRALYYSEKEEDKVSYVLPEIIEEFRKSKVRFALIFHNHPSGREEPSKQDIMETETLQNRLKEEGIVLLDSIILTERGSYFSFRKNRLI